MSLFIRIKLNLTKKLIEKARKRYEDKGKVPSVLLKLITKMNGWKPLSLGNFELKSSTKQTFFLLKEDKGEKRELRRGRGKA